MADDGSDLEFLSPALEWDDQKRELNLAKYGIDFESAVEDFYQPIILRRSDRTMRSAGQLWAIRTTD